MAFTPNFTAVQVIGLPSQILFTDTSTGSDGSISSRQVYLITKDGTYLVPTGTATQYIVWALADSTIAIDALDKDYALVLWVKWVDVSGNMLYEKQILQGEILYNETFDYYTTQMMSANPVNIVNNNFFQLKSDFRTYIDSGNQAIEIGADQTSAQLCYDEATALRLSSQYYFNTNA